MKEVFKQRQWYVFVPLIFLGIALYITYNEWSAAYKSEQESAKFDFYAQHSEMESNLVKKLTLFDQSLHSVSSFFDASNYVSESEFEYFTSNILHSEFSYGLDSISFAKYIDLTDASSYHQVKPDVVAQFHRRDKGLSQTMHAPIIYSVHKNTSPFTPISHLSVFDDATLKSEMLRSAKDDETLISYAVAFDHQQDSCNCISLIRPIYQHAANDGNASLTINQKAVHGWLITKVNLEHLFDIQANKGSQNEIKYSLYHGLEKNEPGLLYNTDIGALSEKALKPSFTHQKAINIHGMQWLLASESLPLFDAKVDRTHSNMVGLLGLIISAALSAALYALFARLRVATELKEVSEKLKLSDDAWQFALEGSGDGVFDWNIKTKQITFSKVWKEMLGYYDGYFEGEFLSWKGLVHPEDYVNVNQKVNAILDARNSHFSVEARMKCYDGGWKPILLRGMVVSRDAFGEAERLVGTSTDLSELKRTEDKAWHHANFDSLTNLPNRQMLHTRIEEEVKKCDDSGRKFALLALDIDKFKEINEALGHDKGDLLIQLVGQRLAAITGGRDTVACLGGASFVVLISDIEASKLNDLDVVAQNFLKSLAEPFVLNGEKAFISASIGIAIYPNDATDIVGLDTCVDHALSAAKKRGGNASSYFKQEMQAHAVKRMQLANDLRTAIKNDELFLTYQPIVDLQTNEIYKAEALIRWQHPERGLIPPFDFIPIAEETRMINEIGDWVFGQAIDQSLAWRKRFDSRFQIAVNKSPIQFLDNNPNDENWTRHLFKQADSKNAIVVEVTEGLLLEASKHVFGWLEYYKKNNIQISLDDFGTGYSSLSYLKKFDMDFLKIDRSFVSNLEASPDDQALCFAIIALSHSLGIKVIAEGIETAAQRDILMKAGCDFGQGYYYSKPVVATEFAKLLEKRSEKVTPELAGVV